MHMYVCAYVYENGIKQKFIQVYMFLCLDLYISVCSYLIINANVCVYTTQCQNERECEWREWVCVDLYVSYASVLVYVTCSHSFMKFHILR